MQDYNPGDVKYQVADSIDPENRIGSRLLQKVDGTPKRKKFRFTGEKSKTKRGDDRKLI